MGNRKLKVDTLGMLSPMLWITRSAALDPLRPIQTLDQDKFLARLNFKENRPPAPKGGSTPRLFRVPTMSQEVSERLRTWVDDWLDSGQTKAGIEKPTSRTFERAQVAAEAVNSYSKRGRLHLFGYRNKLVPWIDLYDEKRGATVGGVSRLAPPVEAVAGEELVRFLLSNLRNKLAKCRNESCGQYFVLGQWNRTYRHGGTFCKDHQRKRSLLDAARATTGERKDAKKQLHNLAGRRFRAQIQQKDEWYRDSELKQQIADYLNAQIARSEGLSKVYPKGVTSKWVAWSMNWKKIVTAAKNPGSKEAR